MESNIRIVSADDLVPAFLELMEETDCVPLVISGSSMTPFLVHGRDTVYLSKIREPLKKGDMVLYRRNNGTYVLHRIHRVNGQDYTMVGDAQTLLEPGIRQNQMLAVVTAVRRKGKLLKPGCFWWIFFQYIWIRLIPLRPRIITFYSALARLFQ